MDNIAVMVEKTESAWIKANSSDTRVGIYVKNGSYDNGWVTFTVQGKNYEFALRSIGSFRNLFAQMRTLTKSIEEVLFKYDQMVDEDNLDFEEQK